MRTSWETMTPDGLNLNDRSEIIRLARIAATRGAQIIIQSRDGSKTYTKCNPRGSGHATLNLSIQEGGEVEKEVKRVISSTSERWSLCIEIFLKTHDEDVLALETWNISLMSGFFTDSTKICRHALAGRFSGVLKSLLTLTRVMPAYRYARQQSMDSFTVGYQLYCGEPSINALGNQFQKLQVGAISTPVGLFQVTLHYRTKMTISPQPSAMQQSFVMMKSDHFRPESSPKHVNRFQSSDNTSKSSVEEDNSPKIGAFVNSRRESLARSESEDSIPNVPFGSLLSAKTLLEHSPSNAVSGDELCERLNAIKMVEKDDANGNVPLSKSESSHDDFIVVDLVKPPFAEPTGTVELVTFYQEWSSAPPLQTCPSDPKVIDQVGDVTSQLEFFETKVEEFDSVVTSLCHGETDDNENV